jgi:FMN-dependent NADH-azoreductase
VHLFRLDASIRNEGSISRALADTVLEEWLAEHPDATVTRRDIGLEPLPLVWPDAVAALMSPPEVPRTPQQLSAKALVAGLVDEMLAADAFLLAVPLYNFGIPQHVKNWVDLLMTDTRVAYAPTPWLAGRPAVLVEARGGGYGVGTPREGWDHATPWLLHLLGDRWGLELSVAAAELTLAESVPAMAELKGLAAQSLADAHIEAAGHGRALGRRLLIAS